VSKHDVLIYAVIGLLSAANFIIISHLATKLAGPA
jgi:hypothetical protein